MEERKPLWKMNQDELESYARQGTEQERHAAQTILVNRHAQKMNPAAFKIRARRTPENG